MLAGTIARLDAPADDPLEDTTEHKNLPALAVNGSQSDLEDSGVIQQCTAANRIEQDQTEAVISDGMVIENRVPQPVDVVSDVVADVTGSGVVVAERVRGSGRYPFPFDLVAAQTGQEIQQYEVDVEAFAESFDAAAIADTWLVGAGDEGGVSMDYNDNAEPEKAGDASVGLGFLLSWEGVMAEGVLYRSGYLAIYSDWIASVFLEFVNDAVMPYAYLPEDTGGEQTTL